VTEEFIADQSAAEMARRAGRDDALALFARNGRSPCG